ncbi:MAG: D-hexose-6-phosphate mutarotase [Oligosphaeraceae bacterium]
MLSLLTGRGGLPEIHLQNSHGRCEICLMGAHVLSYVPRGHREVLFLSEKSEYTPTGKAIRGGIPLCWPWFGPADLSRIPGATTAHGFIRQMMWQLSTWRESQEATEVVLEARDTEESRKIWPCAFRVSLRVRLGEQLELALTTVNEGTQPFFYEEALHTYYAVGDCRMLSIQGFQGCEFKDKAPATPPAPNPQPGEITITEETDRVYFHCPGEAVITDPVMGRRIRIQKEGSDTGVVWNPWIAKSRRMPDFGDEEYRNMVCVENANVDYDGRRLASGESHVLQVRIAVESL